MEGAVRRSAIPAARNGHPLRRRGRGDVALDVFFSALLQVLAPHTFGIMLVGIAIGLVVGILPGLGGAATLAMMLPFVYPMDAVSAFAFLLGMHAVTATTGDITSVLFGIPGEATSAATVLDGYPMTRRGEGGRALGAVLFSSLIGALVGAAVLAVSVPVIRPVVLQLGPPEFLMLTVLGLSFIVSLAGRNLIKGVVMAAFGFLLAMVGLDPQSSIQRFTFGQLYLWEGINVVPVVVGLFGGAEVLQLMMTKQSIARPGSDERLAGVMQGVRDTFEHWGLTLRASAIGLGIGVIPGMGGAVSQFIAYAHAQHTSRHPETFGKGNVEGVLAAGAVNNSREGGNLIPTVAFGIPGSISMAILLSVFLLKGLVPGPSMLTSHLDITYSMVWVIVISNIIAVLVSFLFLNQLVRLTYVRAVLLVPFLMVLTAFGAYTAHNTFADILLMLAATVVGVAAIRWDWPRAPLLLALVLGDIAERYLFLSYSLYEWRWLGRPLVVAFAAVTVGGLLWPVIRRRHDAPRPAAYRADALITIGFLALAAWVLYEAWGWPFRTAVFPLATGVVLLVFSVVKLGSCLVPFTGRVSPGGAKDAPGRPAETDDDLPDIFATASRAEWLSAAGWMAAFFVLLWLAGALVAVPLFALVYLLAAARQSMALAGVYAFICWLFIYGLFDRALHVPLPGGALFA
ncbi:MAG: tripartite tricarboxylate transporter permease [Acidobacteria bacterium]|nr:tripartite tricarboxylate transporter permease [Acidobacteriota bacterium]